MKKTLTAVTVLLALVLCIGAAMAVGGDAGDPLISLAYLQNIFTPTADSAADAQLDSGDQTLRNEAQERLDSMTTAVLAAAGQNFADVAEEVTLNQGDVLSGANGLLAVPLAGEITLSITTGTVIDATTGQEVPTGTALTLHHRYIVAENSAAVFSAASPTAILSYQGSYALSRSMYATDYYGIALALRSLDLFRGSGSGIGEGFDLHLAPTRAEALVMFIRILGEEDDALACTYTHPFTDVPSWLDRYAAWAWTNGYTNGVSPTKFGTAQAVSVVEYQEFLLRALGYSVAGVDDYLTSLERALDCGALTGAEYMVLKEGKFLRAHVAYLSYYNLDTMVSGSFLTLGQLLQQKGTFTEYQLSQARSFVSSARLH